MNIIKQILTNEMAIKLGHAPSKDEFDAIMIGINDCVADFENADKKLTLADISLAIIDYVNDYFVECACNGEYYLPADTTEASDGEIVAVDNLARYEQELAWDRDNKKELQDRWNGLY